MAEKTPAIPEGFEPLDASTPAIPAGFEPVGQEAIPAGFELETGPSVGQLAAGAATEAGFGATGEVVGAALAVPTLGVSYPVAKFTSGFAGSIAAQKIEGQPEISYGRALSAGFINLLPFASVRKGAKVGEILAKEAYKGAGIGAGEAVVTSMIDEQRLPTSEEFLTRVGGGAVGGALVGGALKGGSELIAAAKPSELFQTVKDVASKIAPTLVPSRVLGTEIQDVTIGGKNALLSAVELGGRVARKVDDVVAKQADPNAAREYLNDYLNGKASVLPSYLAPLQGDIDVWSTKMKELQGRLLANIDAGYINASPELRKQIEDSIASGNYLTREYQWFTNSNYRPTAQQKAEAIDELAADYLSQAAAANKTLSMQDARDRALNYLNDLEGKKASVIKNGDYYPSAIDGFLKERKDIGEKLRSYLGEITDPAERMRGTMDRVARGVYRDEMDGRIVDILSRQGLVSSVASDMHSAELKLRRFQPVNKLYVVPEIQTALNNIYLSRGADDTSNALFKGITDFWNTAVGGAKATKVLLNPPSYLVQLYSNAANLVGMGINPFANSGHAMRIALSEFGPFEQLHKNPLARKALLADIAEATKYGIKGANILDSDIRDNLERGLFSEALQKKLGFFSKAYTVADNAGRYVAWKANQKAIQKMFPQATPEAVKELAARWTNNTYQNYDRLSQIPKLASRVGIMPQFAAFTLEFARNQYNQGRIIKDLLHPKIQMVNGQAMLVPDGIFAGVKNLGPINVNTVNAMRAEGMRRLAGLTAVYGSTYAAISAINSNYGVDSEKERALKETVLGDWETNNKLAIIPNADGTGGKYFNPSYIVPHSLGLSAFEAGISGQPIQSLASFAADELVGEGSFLGRSVYAGLFNINPKTGKPISYQTDKARQISDRIAFALSDAFLPGAARETEKLGKAMRGEGKLSVPDVLRRQVGVRFNEFTNEDGAKMNVRKSVDNLKLAAGDYNAARDYKALTPVQLETVYQNANTARMDALNKIVRHASNMKTLGMDDDKVVSVLKDVGLSSKDILGVMTGSIEPLAREKKITASDVYSEIAALPEKDQMRAITKYAGTDPTMYKSLMEKRREELNLKARGVSTMDRLVMSLGIDDGERARYINRTSENMSPAEKTIYLNSLRQKRILTPKVETQLIVYR
jgi:hypothetical protein